MLPVMEKKNKVVGVLSLNLRQVRCFLLLWTTSGKYITGCGKKCTIYGKYRTVGTFDVRHHSGLNILYINVL